MKGNFKKGGFKGGKNTSKTKQIDVTFFIIDQNKVGIQIPYGYASQSLKNLMKQLGNGVWSYDDKCWVIDRSGYQQILQKMQDHFWKINNQQKTNQKIIKVNPIQDFVFKAEQLLKRQLEQIKITNLKPYNNITIKYNSIQTKIDPESLPFYNRLFKFQKQSLKFGIQHHGRMLLADEMGVGKTIQSLALAYIYKHQWPLLIICPPTLKINWQNQIKRWYPDIQPTQIQLVNNSKTVFRVNVLIMIISYDLAWRMKDMFQHIKIVIADQAHYLKTPDSKRSQALVPYLSTRKRVILLTGTPAFARPKQIYNLISIVRPGLFKNFKLFGNRYCDPKYNHWSHSYQYNGCKNVKQLHYILKNNIMIRRLKAQVLTQLPDKNRQKVVLQTDPAVVKNIKQVLQKNNITKMQTFFSQYINQVNSYQQQSNDKRQQIMQAYRMSGMAKIKAVKQYIQEILQNGIKILVFAHHQKVMDQIETQLKNKKRKFMRIDGNVSQTQRAQNVQNFQNDPQILVALLSITAAGVGITLTAASTVIFAQLHWTPALMIQAEDRAHRVGQKNSVNCHYLIGQNTLDEMLYKFLQKKVLNVSSFVDGQKKDLQFEQLKKGEKGKVSKRQDSFSSSQIFNKPRHFGSGLMPQLQSSRKKQQMNSSSQQSNMSELTDISASTGPAIKKPSRKRAPSSNLDDFVIKQSKSRYEESSQQKYLHFQGSNNQNQGQQQASFYETRRSTVFNDYEYYDEQNNGEQMKMKKIQKPNKQVKNERLGSNIKSNNKSNMKSANKSNRKQGQSSQIDSDQQFEKVLEVYYKQKTQSNPSSNNSQRQNELKMSRTKSIQRNDNKDNDVSSSSTKTISTSKYQYDGDVQI